MNSLEDNDDSNDASLKPIIFEDQACISCKADIKNWKKRYVQFNNILKLIDDYCDDIYDIQSSQGSYDYDNLKWWTRYERKLEVVKEMINQNKTMTEIKIYYYGDKG